MDSLTKKRSFTTNDGEASQIEQFCHECGKITLGSCCPADVVLSSHDDGRPLISINKTKTQYKPG